MQSSYSQGMCKWASQASLWVSKLHQPYKLPGKKSFCWRKRHPLHIWKQAACWEREGDVEGGGRQGGGAVLVTLVCPMYTLSMHNVCVLFMECVLFWNSFPKPVFPYTFTYDPWHSDKCSRNTLQCLIRQGCKFGYVLPAEGSWGRGWNPSRILKRVPANPWWKHKKPVSDELTCSQSHGKLLKTDSPWRRSWVKIIGPTNWQLDSVESKKLKFTCFLHININVK